MASGIFNPILYQLSINNLKKSDLCRIIGVSAPTIQSWIDHPETMQLKHIISLAGLFQISVEELVYLMLRNKPKLKNKKNKSGSWYIDAIREKHKDDSNV